ncbi:TerB family tellurite resistance protein [Natronospirillum operosum]|uniref:TerB family tellurite resistance protein n=1 Tax=Natronospirillum operosum TaxID=2759953 RepID=A0A4Z0WI30_9GAMM|nr:TerB family tellurite resistance protein [Natronospirillum operosum]TGG95416.1 TerB family tellurite resistance protein [Natronospirillum operosum]
MLQKLFQWFEQEAEEPEKDTRVELAAAVLMVEVIMADHEVSADEEQVLKERISESLKLPDDEVEAMMAEARKEQEQTLDLYQYTTVINEQFSPTEKYLLLVDLWLLAYANGNVHRYEDALVRKVSDLLYMSHSDFIQAKHEARDQSAAD